MKPQISLMLSLVSIGGMGRGNGVRQRTARQRYRIRSPTFAIECAAAKGHRRRGGRNRCGFVRSGGGADLVEVTGTRGDKLDVVIARGEKGDVIASRGEGLRGDKLAVSKPSLSNVYATLFDPRFALDVPSGFVSDTPVEQVALASSAPPPAASSARNDRAAKSATAPRPNLAPIRTAAARDDGQNQPAADRPTMLQSIFAKLFGKPAPVTLAYAATDDAGLSTSKNIVGRYDRYTAVYDISAHTVYMPDGSQLEAHSGLGDRLDDPRHADERMHGVTPPNIYNL